MGVVNPPLAIKKTVLISSASTSSVFSLWQRMSVVAVDTQEPGEAAHKLGRPAAEGLERAEMEKPHNTWAPQEVRRLGFGDSTVSW